MPKSRSTNLLCLALVIAVLSSSSSVSASYPSALGTAAVQTWPVAMTHMSYSVTVPPLPAANTGQAVEFHAGMLSSDKLSFIKSTISYGCEVGQSQACFAPFLNRYIFYISLINLTSLVRTQFPSTGVVVTPGSTYSISLSLSKCSSTASEVLYSVSNSTWSSS